MKKSLLLVFYILISTSLFAQNSLEFSKIAGDNNPTGNGPVVSTNIKFLNNTDNNTNGNTFALYNSPSLSATISIVDQQYANSSVASPSASTFIGWGGAPSVIYSTGANGWYGDPVNSDFTSVNRPSGQGISTTNNYNVVITNTVRPMGSQNRRGKIYQGRLEITFDRPVTDPIVHISGLGGNAGTVYFSTTLDLNLAQSLPTNSTITLTKLSGDNNFAITGSSGNSINNSFANPLPVNGTSWHSSGSVKINGTNLTKVSFDLYTQGYSGNAFGNGNYGTTDGQGDSFGVSLSVSEANIVATNDNFGTAIMGNNPYTTSSVLANDTYNGNPATTSNNVTLSPAEAYPPGFTLNSDGTITIANTVPSDTYNLKYTICDINNPQLCKTATATITVNSGPVCGGPVAGEAFEWNYPAGNKPEGSIVSNEFTQPAANDGFVLDLYELDNSFNMTINGTQLSTTEMQFQGGNGTLARNIRFLSDGALWGVNVGDIWTIHGTASNPIIRVTISPAGVVNVLGSRTSGGPLEALQLYNGNTFNNITWNPYSSNTVIASQFVIGQTIMKGYGYGLNKTPCYCTKSPATGIPDGYTKVGISSLATRSNNWPAGTTLSDGGVPNGFIALESKNKGFVITRVASSASIADPKKGMLIYDVAAACVKLYNGSTWKCLERSCNDSLIQQ